MLPCGPVGVKAFLLPGQDSFTSVIAVLIHENRWSGSQLIHRVSLVSQRGGAKPDVKPARKIQLLGMKRFRCRASWSECDAAHG